MVRVVLGLHRKSPLAATDLVFRLTRTSPTPPDLDAVLQRAISFGSAVASITDHGERVTLLTARTERETSSYVITPGQGNNSHVVTNLSSALGATAIQVDDPDEIATILNSPCASFLVARPNRRASFATQASGNPNEVAVLLSQLLQPGMWVAVTLRGARGKEQERVRMWFDHRHEMNSSTHYSNNTHPLIATFYAGAISQSDVATILNQTVSAIPGFDVEAKPFSSGSRIPLWSAPIVGVLAEAGVHYAASHATAHVAYHVVHHAANYTTLSLEVGLGATALSVIASLIPPPGSRLSRQLRKVRPRGILPSPQRRLTTPRKPLKKDVTNERNQTRHINWPGAYPLAPASFLINAPMAVGIVSPHSGSRSAVADTEYRSVPSELLDDVGPIVGYADVPGSDDVPVAVHIDANEMFGGVGALGLPGTGKTTLLQQLWAWHVLERVYPSGRPGFPGAYDVLIAFESKRRSNRTVRAGKNKSATCRSSPTRLGSWRSRRAKSSSGSVNRVAPTACVPSSPRSGPTNCRPRCALPSCRSRRCSGFSSPTTKSSPMGWGD
jgi:hypothetical protein